MKTIIAAFVTCLVLFAASLGTSKFLLQSPTEDPVDVPPSDATTEPVDDGKVDSSSVPVSLRPENAVSIEAVLQMSDSIKKMEQQLQLREREVAKKEQRAKLLFDDLATEQEQLKAMSDGIEARLNLLNQKTAEFRAILDQIEQGRSELEALAKDTGTDEQSQRDELENKVNDVKGWFENLQSDQAADYLKNFANSGKLEFAASLLHKLPRRQQSKILAAMNDPTLVDQLIDALSTRKKK